MLIEFIQRSRPAVCLVPHRQTYCQRCPALWEKVGTDRSVVQVFSRCSVPWRPNIKHEKSTFSAPELFTLMITTVLSHSERDPKT